MGGFENPAGNNQRQALSAVFLADSCYSFGVVICSLKPNKIITFGGPGDTACNGLYDQPPPKRVIKRLHPGGKQRVGIFLVV